MSKPAYGTLIAANAMTASMRLAYLLNGSDLNALVNSVGGAEPLVVTGSGMSYDSGTESMSFANAGILQVPTTPLAALSGIAAATLLVGYKSASPFVSLWSMSGFVGGGDGEYSPYNDGNIYSDAMLSLSRYSFATPGGVTFSAFNQLGITGAGGGNILYYLNGSLRNTHAAEAAIHCGTSGHIGHNSDGFYLTGNIQFLYAWTRVLSATELATLSADPYGPVFPGAPPPGGGSAPTRFGTHTGIESTMNSLGN